MKAGRFSRKYVTFLAKSFITPGYYIPINNDILEINDYEELLNLRKKSRQGSFYRMGIEKRMIELNKIQLPRIKNYKELARYRAKSYPGGTPRKQIEDRMRKLNKIQLPKMTDYYELVSRWKISSSDSYFYYPSVSKKLRKQVEIRIMKLINSNPQFLVKAFRKGQDGVPKFMKKALIKIAKKIVG